MYEFFSFLNYGSNASLASMHGTPLLESMVVMPHTNVCDDVPVPTVLHVLLRNQIHDDQTSITS
jgi:hypothetical protein